MIVLLFVSNQGNKQLFTGFIRCSFERESIILSRTFFWFLCLSETHYLFQGFLSSAVSRHQQNLKKEALF